MGFPPESAFAKVEVLKSGKKLAPNQIALMLLEDIENDQVESVVVAIRWKNRQLTSAFSSQSSQDFAEAVAYLQTELQHALWQIHNAETE